MQEHLRLLPDEAKDETMNDGLQKLFQGIFILAAVLVAGAVLLVSVSTLPTLFGYQSYTVRSGSMEPTVPTGAVVVTRVTPPEELQVGDVISFYTDLQPGVMVTHRLVGVERSGGALRFRTKGDANGSQDVGQVNVAFPVARVVYWVPLAGYLLVYVSDPGARFLLLGMGVLLLWTRGRLGTRRSGLAAGSSSPEVQQPRA